MIEIINYLSTQLARMVHVSPRAARGLMKLAIKDQLGPFFDFKQITFQEIKLMMKESLKSRIIKLNIANVEEIILELEKELISNQSLIEMSKV